jgi:hypothetical protein
MDFIGKFSKISRKISECLLVRTKRRPVILQTVPFRFQPCTDHQDSENYNQRSKNLEQPLASRFDHRFGRLASTVVYACAAIIPLARA